MISIGVALALLAAPLLAEAASLQVSPARIMVNGIQPGKTYDLFKETGVRLNIVNDSSQTYVWNLKAYRPSERGRWETGYGEVPDASWFWFDTQQVSVEPHGVGYGHLFFRIPDEERYYNQHWIATLAVEGEEKGLSLGLAVEIRMQIETIGKSEVSGAPHGVLAMSPSEVQLKDVDPGELLRQTVAIYNNDAVDRTYTIGSLFLDDRHEPRTYIQHGYQLLPVRAWLQQTQELSIPSGGVAELEIAVRVPNEPEHYGKKWEDCILIQPDEGRAEFIRVQIETNNHDHALQEARR